MGACHLSWITVRLFPKSSNNPTRWRLPFAIRLARDWKLEILPKSKKISGVIGAYITWGLTQGLGETYPGTSKTFSDFFSWFHNKALIIANKTFFASAGYLKFSWIVFALFQCQSFICGMGILRNFVFNFSRFLAFLCFSALAKDCDRTRSFTIWRA